MKILLGIYRAPHFMDIMKQEIVSTYPFYELIDDYSNNSAMDDIIMDTVLEASRVCTGIIFLIDDILPNMDTNISVTCRELITLLSSSLISKDKIEFREDNIIVSLDYVCNKLNINKGIIR